MLRLRKWFENYWYHNKWPTLIVLFFIITFVIGFGQIAAEKNSYDVYTLYAGPTYIQKEPHDDIVKVLTDVAKKVSKDDTDAEKDVNFQMLVYLTDEQIEEQKAEVEGNGEKFIFDYLENNNVLETYMKQLVSGENVIMFLDPFLYETAEKNEALYSIKDIFGRELPGMTEAGFGIKLSESGLLEKYPPLEALPEDCIVCFRKVTHAMKLIGKSESQNSHSFQLDVAREMFSGINE